MLVFSVPVFVMGLWILWAARRGFDEGDAPHCSKCDYNLTPVTNERSAT